MTPWASRLLCHYLGLRNARVSRAWRAYGVQPRKAETFKLSTDPELVAKVTNVVGLYLAPPDNAIVLCVDEKSQIQALYRTAPMRPLRIGDAEKRTHDYNRHGTTTVFAALEVATGTVTGAVKAEHHRSEFLSFLCQIDRVYPDQELHLVMDNYATHKNPEVRDWLTAHPRFHLHFTPMSGSWLNLVEAWFGIIDRQAIKRGVFTSVKDMNAKIWASVTGWNTRKHPLVRTKHRRRFWRKRTVNQLQKRDTNCCPPILIGPLPSPMVIFYFLLLSIIRSHDFCVCTNPDGGVLRMIASHPQSLRVDIRAILFISRQS